MIGEYRNVILNSEFIILNYYVLIANPRYFSLAVVVASLILASLMQGPYLLHRMHPAYKGIPVSLNSDEEVYLARVEEALSGRPEQAAEAFIGHPGLVGTQPAPIEAILGILYRPTGWNAGTVLTIEDSVEPVLVFLVLLSFFIVAGFSRWKSFVAASAFCLIELYNLNRPIHMRASFLLMMLALIGISAAVQACGQKRKAESTGMILGGAMLGLLVGIYFWSFNFAWIWFGIFLFWEIIDWIAVKLREQRKRPSRIMRILATAGSVFWHFRPRKPTFRFERWHVLAIAGCIALLAAAPSVAGMLQMTFKPFYGEGIFRSGMHPSHLPESWPYTVIFFTMAVSVIAATLREPELLRPYRPAVVAAVAAFVYANQQIIHGVVFNFVSHGIFSLMLAALCMVLLWVTLRRNLLLIGACAAVVYLAAIAYDGRYIFGQWIPSADQYSEQHLADVLPVLNAMPRTRILSDYLTSSVLSGYTKHDVVFSTYLKNVLLSNEELARRFCLMLEPVPPPLRHISEMHHLIFPDASAAFGPAVRKEEERIVEEQCRTVDLDPVSALSTFEVSYVLWNSVEEPDWDLKRLRVPLTEVARGEGWVLMHIEK